MVYQVIEDWTRTTASGAVLLAGFHSVKHALRFGVRPHAVVAVDRAAALAMADDLAPDVREALAAALTVVPADTFARLVPGGHHTGVAAPAAPRRWTVPTDRATPLVFLDDPRHLGNYGAVVRVAAGLGAAGVVSTGTVDPWHPTVLRGAAGLQFALPVLRVDGPPVGRLVAFDGAGRDARAARIPDDAVLAFGSERRGLSRQVLDAADQVLALPMRPGVASYNLASAVAMALYQWALGATVVTHDQPDPGDEHRGGGE